MRSFTMLFLAAGLLVLAADRVRAADDATAVLDKAIKAHGGADKLNKDKDKAEVTKSKGTIEALGQSIPYTEETTMQTNRIKSVLELTVSGQTVTQTTIYNGDKAWVNVVGKTMELEGKTMEEVKEAIYLARVTRLTDLKDKVYELSSVGEVKVNGRPAVGVKVASKGHRDVNLFFDKETGLLAKIERQAVDPMTEKEFTEERIVTEYQEKDGVKIPKKAVVNRDGKKFIDVEVLETKTRDKFDDSEFAKP
jgi:hypothetical protein